MELPTAITQRILDCFPNGGDWMARLESHILEIGSEWQLELDTEATTGNYSFVIPAGECMLKLLPPGEDFDRQLGAMLAWNGNGAARIEKYDAGRGAMLIERLRPGTELSAFFHEGREEEATEIACDIMGRLAIPLPSLGGVRGGLNTPIPTAADRAADLANLRKRFNGKTGPFPEHLVVAAEGFFRDLVASQGTQYLIHGDLHHENILAAQREPWLAIDPHGLIAEPEFEIYAWLLNPIGIAQHPDVKDITARRLDQMTDLLGFDRGRIRGWGVACAVLSAWWSLDGHNSGYEDALTMAQVLLES